jgi:hypothetical protein
MGQSANGASPSVADADALGCETLAGRPLSRLPEIEVLLGSLPVQHQPLPAQQDVQASVAKAATLGREFPKPGAQGFIGRSPGTCIGSSCDPR